MADPNLTESAWQKAKQDAARIYPTTEFGVAATLMTIIFGAVAAVASTGENTTTQIAVPIIGGTLALALTFAVLFAVQLAAAPVRQRNELRTRWETPAIETVNVELSLRNIQRKGDELATRLEVKEGHTTAERKETEAWADDVVSLMSGRVPDEATRKFLATGEEETGIVRRLRTRVATLWVIIDEQFGAEG